MIIRLSGDRFVQIIHMYDTHEDATFFRARKVDHYGRSQGEFTAWDRSCDKVIEQALQDTGGIAP